MYEYSDSIWIGFVVFIVLYMLYMAYRQSKVSKKTFDFINESHRVTLESLEVSKKMLQELETISKNLKK